MSETNEPITSETPVEKPHVFGTRVFSEVAPVPTSRAFQPDIADTEQWLIPRLMDIYPNSTFIGLRTRLQHACVSNEEYVVRSANAIAAIRAVQENMTGAPYGWVWFALGKNGEADAEEIAELHFQMLAWMKRAGMTVMRLSSHIDCDRSFIRARIGKITKHEVWAWHADLQPGKEA
jgi:hypothetical protein